MGGIMHISSNNLSRVRSTFNGGRSPVTNARTESGPSMSECPATPPSLAFGTAAADHDHHLLTATD